MFPEDSIFAVVNRPLPPGIEAHRARLVEMIDAIDAEAKRDIEALPLDMRAEQSYGILEKAQERAQGLNMELVRIEELYRKTFVTVRLPPAAD